MVHIGLRLKQARMRAGLSQQEAATAINVTRSTLANWEAGRHSPSLVQFRALLTLYAASGYEILFGDRRFELTREETAELIRVTANCSVGLQAKVALLMSMLAVTDGP